MRNLVIINLNKHARSIRAKLDVSGMIKVHIFPGVPANVRTLYYVHTCSYAGDRGEDYIELNKTRGESSSPGSPGA